MGDPPTNPPMGPLPPSMPLWKKRKLLLKELSLSQTPQHVAWERRRHLKLKQDKKKTNKEDHEKLSEDLNELKGCIELGFGFNEDEGGQSLTTTLPALDIYFAVNRLGSPMVSPSGNASPIPKLERAGSFSMKSDGSPSPFGSDDSWKICSPGEDPKQVKAKLRHWAQAVACSVIQSS